VSLILVILLAAPHKTPAAKKEQPAAAAQPSAPAKGSSKAAAPEPTREVIKRESNIEFDERVVQGQRAQGAVYLFQRADTEFTSLVKTPSTFRSRTVDSVYGDARKAQ